MHWITGLSAGLLSVIAIACSEDPELLPLAATPDIDATIEAAISSTETARANIQATVLSVVEATVDSLNGETVLSPIAANTPIAVPLPEEKADDTPVVLPVPTPTSTPQTLPASTPTSVPPTAIPTQESPHRYEVQHDLDIRTGASLPLHLSASDFLLEVEFVNPYQPSSGKWSYGFSVRTETTATTTFFAITSDGEILSYVDREGSTTAPLNGQHSFAIRTGNDQTNVLKLIVVDGQYWFLVNNSLLDEITLPSNQNEKIVSVMTGVRGFDQQRNAVTRFSDPRFRPIPVVFGPRDGEIPFNPDSVLLTASGVDIQQGVVKVILHPPDVPTPTQWSYGIVVREQPNGEASVFLLNQDRVFAQMYQTSWESELSLVDVLLPIASPTNVNAFTILILDGIAKIYANNFIVSTVSLVKPLSSGDISVFSAFFEGDEASSLVRYEGFKVWSLDETPLDNVEL